MQEKLPFGAFSIGDYVYRLHLLDGLEGWSLDIAQAAKRQLHASLAELVTFTLSHASHETARF